MPMVSISPMGSPTVKYCAQELFLSPNYFGDLFHQMTDDTASNAIRRFVMQRAQKLLISGSSITQTAELLGFDYPATLYPCIQEILSPPGLLSPSAYLSNCPNSLFALHDAAYPLKQFVEGVVAAVGTVPCQQEVHVLARILEFEGEIDGHGE